MCIGVWSCQGVSGPWKRDVYSIHRGRSPERGREVRPAEVTVDEEGRVDGQYRVWRMWTDYKDISSGGPSSTDEHVNDRRGFVTIEVLLSDQGSDDLVVVGRVSCVVRRFCRTTCL